MMNDRVYEALKLLNDEALVNEREIEDFVEYLVQQAAGWGLRQRDRVALTLARAAAEGKQAVLELDETQRKLKGLQLELGRNKSRIEKLLSEKAELEDLLNAAHEYESKLETELAELRAEEPPE